MSKWPFPSEKNGFHILIHFGKWCTFFSSFLGFLGLFRFVLLYLEKIWSSKHLVGKSFSTTQSNWRKIKEPKRSLIFGSNIEKKGPFGTWNISTYFVIVLRNPKGEETDKIQWRTFAIIVKRGICFTVQKFNHFSAIQILRVMTHKNSNYGRILKLATFIVGNVRNSPKLILRKIWVTEKLLNFHTLKTQERFRLKKLYTYLA